MERKNISLKFSLSTAFAIVISLTVLAMGTGVWININKMVQKSIEERLHDAVLFGLTLCSVSDHSQLQSVSDENTPPHLRLVKACKQVMKINPDIRYIYTMRMNKIGKIEYILDSEYGDKSQEYVPIGEVYTDASQEMYDYFKNPEDIKIFKEFYTDQWGTWLTGVGLIKNPDGSIDGVLGVDISVDKIAYYQKKYLAAFAVFLIIVLIFTMMIGSYIARRISKPIQNITNDMQKIKKLDLQGNLEFNSAITEVYEMGTALENMKKGLRSFRKFVPADVVNDLIQMNREAVLGSEKKEISIFFSDIKDFTAISEEHAPERLAEMLGEYFEGMTGILQINNATVDKYIGDAIMAFWGAPKPLKDNALYACRAALACQNFLQNSRNKWKVEEKPPFHTRIGINTGEAVVGNMGYEKRMSYTAIGDSVNLASRLEALNKYYGTDIMVNETTYEKVKNEFYFRLLDIVAVKGKKRGVRVYELAGDKNSLDEERIKWIQSFNNAMELYLKRKWNESSKIFNELNRQMPSDKTLEIMLKRIEHFEKTPPPENWSGVVIMREK